MPGWTPKNLIPNPWPDTAVTGWSAAGASGVGVGGSPMTVAGMPRARSVAFFRNNLTAGIVSGRSPLASVSAGKFHTGTMAFRLPMALAANSGAFVSVGFYDSDQNYISESKYMITAAVAADTPFRSTAIGWAPKNAVYAAVLFSFQNAPAIGTNCYATCARLDQTCQRNLPYNDGDDTGWTYGTNRASSTGPAVVRTQPTGADALQTRTLSELQRWRNWLDDNAAHGLVGEFNTCTVWEYYGGAGATTNQQPFMDLLTAYMNGLQYTDLGGTAWASGREFDQGYPLAMQVPVAVNGALAVTRAANAIVAGRTIDAQRLLGVNLSGAEQGVGIAGGGTVRSGTPYWHTDADVQYVSNSGVEVVRLPIAWERFQPTLNGALDTTQLTNLRTFLASCRTWRIKVILDLHNYGRYTLANGTTVYQLGDANGTSAALADFWVKMSAALATNALDNQTVLGFDIMNEPNGLAGGANAWETASQAVVVALRNANDWRRLYIEGYQFSNLFYWAMNHPDGWISDPAANFSYSAHHYWDTQSAGVDGTAAPRSGQWQQKNTAGTGHETMAYATELAAANAQANYSSRIVENFNTQLPAGAEPSITGTFKNQYGPDSATGKTSGRNGVYNGRYRMYFLSQNGTTIANSGLATSTSYANGVHQLDDLYLAITAVTSQTATPTTNNIQVCWRSGNANGTRLLIEFNRKTGQLTMGSQVNFGYSVAGTTVTYDPVAHRYLRMVRSGAALLFQASATGLTWTTLRTEATAPAWLDTANQSLQVLVNRDGVADNTYLEIDCVNVQNNADPGYSTRFFNALLDGVGNYPSEYPSGTPVWRKDMGRWYRYASGVETTVPAADGSTSTQRCELVPEGVGMPGYEYAGRHLLELVFYLPLGFPVSFPSWQVITQLKNDETQIAGSPPWEMKIGNGRLSMDGNYSAWSKDVCAIKAGRTYRVIIDITLATTPADSKVSVWVNGTQMVQDYSPSGSVGFLYNVANARNYWKFGLYRDNSVARPGTGATIIWGAVAYEPGTGSQNRLVNHSNDTTTEVVDTPLRAGTGAEVPVRPTRARSRAIGPGVGAEYPRAVARSHTRPLGAIPEAEVPARPTGSKRRTLGVITQAEYPLGLKKGNRYTALGFATTQEKPGTLVTGSKSRAIGRVIAASYPKAMGRSHTKPLGRVTAAELPKAMGRAKTSPLLRQGGWFPETGQSFASVAFETPYNLGTDFTALEEVAIEGFRFFKPTGANTPVYTQATIYRKTDQSEIIAARVYFNASDPAGKWSYGYVENPSQAILPPGTYRAAVHLSANYAYTPNYRTPPQVQKGPLVLTGDSQYIYGPDVNGQPSYPLYYVGNSTSVWNFEVIATPVRSTRAEGPQRLSRAHTRALGSIPERSVPVSLGRSRTRTLARITGAEVPGRLGAAKRRSIGSGVGVSVPRRLVTAMSRTVGRIVSSSVPGRMAGVKLRVIGKGTGKENAGRLAASKTRVLGTVAERQELTRVMPGLSTALSRVVSSSVPARMGRSKRWALMAGRSAQTTGSLGRRKVRGLGQVIGAEMVARLTGAKNRAVTRGVAQEKPGVLVRAKTRPLTATVSAEHTFRPAGHKTRSIGKVIGTEDVERLRGAKLRPITRGVGAERPSAGFRYAKARTLGTVRETVELAAPFLGSTIEVGPVRAEGEKAERLRGEKARVLGTVREEQTQLLGVNRSRPIHTVRETQRMGLTFSNTRTLGKITGMEDHPGKLRSRFRSGEGNRAYHEGSGLRPRQEGGKLRAYHL